MVLTCQYCGVQRPTSQGIRSHITQSKACRKKQFDEYEALESSDSESGDTDNSRIADAGDADVDLEFGGLDTVLYDNSNEAESDEDFTLDPPRPDLERDANLSAPPVDANPGSNKRARVEEEEDEDARWVQPCPAEYAAGGIYERCKTAFEKAREAQRKEGHPPWYPFESEDEWEVARWLMTSGLSQTKVEEHLKLKKVLQVREGMKLSFHNNRAFLQRIDMLPDGPQWRCYPFTLVGDEVDLEGKKKEQTVEMWCRDPVECVKELVGNTAFAKQAYEPCRIFKRFADGKYSNREYNEMWTGDWWWEIQQLLPEGATLVPIILASDKTQLTRFSGDQQAWPVYLTIGNIDKATRRAPSSRATVLLGYIPVAKMEIFAKARRAGVAQQLFHDCMAQMLESLKVAGEKGVMMDCADGFVRRMYLILAAYIADYPEQCLICCCKENSCPGCLCHPKSRGDTCHFARRNAEETRRILSEQQNGEYPTEFVAQNLRPLKPFWADLPHCDIFRCMTPDLLHELHNGAFGDHVVKWSTIAFGSSGVLEVDHRFRAMTPHPSLRHFKKGISLTTQWTGTERKNMEKVFLGILANATEPALVCAVRGILDFIYYAHFETHCEESLVQMDAAWLAFHDNKHAFKNREHFNISKIHKLKHYVDSICSRGTAPGFNTEGTERLHIDLAKVAYNATNKKAYTHQMTVWLRRQEAVHKFGSYLQWAIPGYLAPIDTALSEEIVVSEEGEMEVGSESAADVPDEAEESEDEGELDELPTFTIAKTPAFPNVSVSAIETDFHAPDFIRYLSRFLESKSIIPRLIPTHNTPFPLYKRLSLTLPHVPEVGSSPVRDTIRAVKGEQARFTANGIVAEKPGQFDTILARVESTGANAGPTDGLCVARVRVIFRIPAEFGPYPEPVAYVNWFKPLQQPVVGLGMHQVSLSRRMNRQNSSIIPVTDILRSCHLIPVFGKVANRTWESGIVLNQCDKFYLNPYLRHHDFFLFRYLVDVHASRKAAEERRVRIRALGRAGR
ncbi:hypothetical protein B0H16DRAFT_1878677 [Mycena metata]|uniref:Transposase domain-containing protein n=1 Tax=Mycena metata TaxID=1033252 RepID=A0AAD7K6C4_9AGAR|nr:hypothetical protein B0H16DRAFT_1878677 [Mycena metata]